VKFNLDGTRPWSVVGIVLLSLAATSLHAEQQWPSGKTVRIVVPYAPGGPGEAVIRLLAQEVSDRTKSNIVVEPRPGASTVIGTETVARSSPDGATLLLVANSFIINSSLRAGLPYDPLTSFSPICLLASSSLLLVVANGSSHQSVAQFIAATREPQSRITVGGTGPNSTQQLTVEAMKRAGLADLAFVPFAGDLAVVSNVLGGHITAGLAHYASVKTHLGVSLRALAVGSRGRFAELPDVPTFAEAGFDEIDALGWIGLVVPANTPEQSVGQIVTHFRVALDAPEVRSKLQALALQPLGVCGKEFAAFLREQHERTAGVVKAANMKAE
jgi:tripartite-type tricarboxylate transporter receptor subunit TctC